MSWSIVPSIISQTARVASSSPGVVVANTESVGASLMVWLVSGVLAWTGASSFAELGSAIPQNGGAQAYLSYAYGPLVSYLFAWTAIIALKPGCYFSISPSKIWSNTLCVGGNAVIALIFAEYMNRLFFGGQEISPDNIPQWAIRLTASGAVLIVTFLCVVTRSLSTRIAVIFTTAKVGQHFYWSQVSLYVIHELDYCSGTNILFFHASKYDSNFRLLWRPLESSN